MIETIVSGLIVAAVSGLTFLSYKHHEGYVLLTKPLRLALCAAFIAVLFYSIGFTNGKYSKDGEMSFSYGWVTIGFIAFVVFMGILDFLPMLTKKNSNKHEQ